MLKGFGPTRKNGLPHALRAFVLCGYQKDTIADAEQRMQDCIEAGFTPYAMLYRNKKGIKPGGDWPEFQRQWVRPALIHRSQPK